MSDAIALLNFHYSGGGTNSDSNLSLGGGISTTVIRTQAGTDPAVLTGLSVVDGVGNAEGTGTLSYTYATTTATWAANGDSAGTGVDISSDGSYILSSATAGFVIITVDWTALSAITWNQSESITVSNIDNGIFDDINTVEAISGDDEYRCVYIKNNNLSGTAQDVRVWVATDATGADSIAIGLGTAAISAQEQTVADESTAPIGVTFSAPADYANGLLVGDLVAGAYRSIWIKRSVPAETTTATANDTFSLGFGCTFV